MVFARLGRRTPMNGAVVALAVATHGIWTRSCSRSGARSTLCGGRWIRMATCWICGSQSRRDTKAAKRFFRKLRVRLHYVPRVIITDKLRRYGAAKREIVPGVEHRQQKGLNNRAENSHQPTRLREKNMRRFRIRQARTTFAFCGLRLSQGISNRVVIVCVPGNIVPFYRTASWYGTR